MAVSLIPHTMREKILAGMHRSYVTMQLPWVLEAPLVLAERLAFERGMRKITIQKPIFIVGCHRSGTTVLYEALAKHPDLAYFTNASNQMPRAPILSNVFGRLTGLD